MITTKPRCRPATERLVIERVPSHDGTPTVAAYHELDDPNDWRTTVCKLVRPLFAFRIYDTTPDAADATNLCHVAKVIFEETLEARSAGRDRDVPDRIEVIGLPMSPDATDHERALKCREFETAEIAARKNPGMRDWYLRRRFENGEYSSSIHVISRLCQGNLYSSLNYWFYIEHVRRGGLDAELELGELPPDQLSNPT
ncbi:hypothetical protein E8E14_013426 [Neopestalotiopsis sp. 37M]|nr:hypothetical protein E8E14_013426 [Neopestalotiopsis sp. 37M]